MQSRSRPHAIASGGWRGIVIALALVCFTTSPARSQCAGDCGADGAVTIDELVRCVGIALGNIAIGECRACDASGDGAVAINDLIQAVASSLGSLRLTADGRCVQPGPEGLTACAQGTVLRLWRCDDRSRCLAEVLARTLLAQEIVGVNGAVNLDIDTCQAAGRGLLLEAVVDPEGAPYRVMDLGSASSAAGAAAGVDGDDFTVGPSSEAAARLIDEAGLEHYPPATVVAVTAAVEAANADTDFAGLDAEAAASVATEQGRNDEAVQALLAVAPTPTPTATPIPEVRWVAPGDGDWNDPDNWSSGAVPGPTDNVVVETAGTPPTISHNAGTTVVRQLRLDGTLLLTGGSFAVTGDAEIGALTCSGTLRADGAGANLVVAGQTSIDGCSLAATGGGSLQLPNVATANADPADERLASAWRAQGAGSVLDLGALTTLRGVVEGFSTRLAIEASAGGVIVLDALTSNPEGRLALNADGAGSRVELDALPALAPGASLTARNGGTLDVPLITELDSADVRIEGATTPVFVNNLTRLVNGSLTAIGAGVTVGPASLSAFDGSGAEAAAGAVLALPAVTAYVADPNQVQRQPLWTATGIGSRLTFDNLASLRGVVTGFSTVLRVVAAGGGGIDLQAVESNPEGRVSLRAEGAASSIGLVSLPGLAPGGDLTVRNGGSIDIPEITALDDVDLTIEGDASDIDTAQLQSFTRGVLTIAGQTPDFANLQTLDGSSVLVSGGVAVMLNGVVSYRADPDAVQRQPTWSADGAGSELFFGGLEVLEGVVAGFSTRLEIEAVRGGNLHFGSVAEQVGRIALIAEGTGSVVELPTLTNITRGSTIRASGGGLVAASQVTELDGVALTIDGVGSVVTAPLTTYTNGLLTCVATCIEPAALGFIDGSSVELSAGATLSLPVLETYSADPENRQNQARWRISGSGSTLDLPSLVQLTGVVEGFSTRMRIETNSGARAFLTGLVAVPAGRVTFAADGANSRLDISSVGNIDGVRLVVEETNGGDVVLLDE